MSQSKKQLEIKVQQYNSMWSSNTSNYNGVRPPYPSVSGVHSKENEYYSYYPNLYNLPSNTSSVITQHKQDSKGTLNEDGNIVLISSNRYPYAVEHLNNRYGSLGTKLGTNLGSVRDL